MTTHQTLDKDTLRSLLTTIRDTSWTWREQDVPDLAARFGWTEPYIVPGMGAFVDQGHALGSKAFRMVFSDSGRVDIITMRISSKVAEDDPAGQLFLDDVFADTAAAATEILGPPTAQKVGDQPEVRWRGEESTLILVNLSIDIELTWASNEYQDHWDALD